MTGKNTEKHSVAPENFQIPQIWYWCIVYSAANCGSSKKLLEFLQIKRWKSAWNLAEKRNVAHFWDSSYLKFDVSVSFINSLQLRRLQQMIRILAKIKIKECLKYGRKT